MARRSRRKSESSQFENQFIDAAGGTEKIEETPPVEEKSPLTGEQKMLAFRRYGSAAYKRLRSQKTKVTETEVRKEAYRMYLEQ